MFPLGSLYTKCLYLPESKTSTPIFTSLALPSRAACVADDIVRFLFLFHFPAEYAMIVPVAASFALSSSVILIEVAVPK